MITDLRLRAEQQWQEFAASQPGNRFQERYHRRRQQTDSVWTHILLIAAGVVALVGGFIMLFIPGPGVLATLLGAALIAERSYLAARALDWLELRTRRVARWTNRVRRNRGSEA